MSAYVVGKPHLDYLLTYGLLQAGHKPLAWLAPANAEVDGCQRRIAGAPGAGADLLLRKRQLTRDTADAVGNMLLEQNIRGVNSLYDIEGEAETMYAFEVSRVSLDPVQVLKALKCYEYQACNDPGWKGSEAWAFCDALRRLAIARLPGYEQAAWEVQ